MSIWIILCVTLKLMLINRKEDDEDDDDERVDHHWNCYSEKTTKKNERETRINLIVKNRFIIKVRQWSRIDVFLLLSLSVLQSMPSLLPVGMNIVKSIVFPEVFSSSSSFFSYSHCLLSLFSSTFVMTKKWSRERGRETI